MKTVKVGEHKAPLKDMKKFIASLRSGEFKQTRVALQNANGFCCLGVGCFIFIPKELHLVRPESKYLEGGLPCAQEHAPKWLKELNSDVQKRFGVELTVLNDAHNFTFKEIAHVLDLIYIKGAL